jgi:polyhydroxyalkanoate synthesis regulator phasin
MSNMKIISIMDAEIKAASAAVENDIQTALAVVEDELDGVRASFQHQIDELKQRVEKLEAMPR